MPFNTSTGKMITAVKSKNDKTVKSYDKRGRLVALPKRVRPVDQNKDKTGVTYKSKPKPKRKFVRNPVKKLTDKDLFLIDVRRAFYQPFTYPGLIMEAKAGNKVAGFVVAMKIRAGYISKDDCQYLDYALMSTKTPTLKDARDAFCQVGF